MSYTPHIEQIRRKLPKPASNYELLVSQQNVFDIVRHTLTNHAENTGKYDAIAKDFWKGSPEETARCIFDFCKQHVPYKAENTKTQTVKTPEQILYDSSIAGLPQDCKHYASFICGIIDSLHRQGYPISCKYRFASDVKGKKYPTHVFAVVPTSTGEMWVDPVLPTFNQDHRYYYFLTKQCPKPMALYKVSGIDNEFDQGNYVSGLFGYGSEIGKAGKGKAKVKAAVHSISQGAKNTAQKIQKVQPGKVAVKVSLSASRNAFLLLLKLNIFDMAYNLYKYAQTPAGLARIKSTWAKVGGNWQVLAKNINQGFGTYKKLHKKSQPAGWRNISGLDEAGEYIGAITAASIAAAVAAAMPIITAFTAIFKDLGINLTKVKKTANGGATVLSVSHNTSDGKTEQGTETDVYTDSQGNQVLNVHKFEGNKIEQSTTPGMYAPGGDYMPHASPVYDDYGTQSAYDIPGSGKADKAVNVVSNWGARVADFIENNKGLVTTGVVIFGVLGLANSSLFTGKKRR